MRFTMDQVATLLGRSGRGFAMENPNPRPSGELTVQGVSVGVAYVKSVIDSLGLKEFLRLNPWAEQYVTDSTRETTNKAQDGPVRPRKVRCLECGLTFWTNMAKGAVKCPNKCNPGTFYHNIRELEKYWTPPEGHEFKKGEVIEPPIEGSVSDSYDPHYKLRNMYKFRRKPKRWY